MASASAKAGPRKRAAKKTAKKRAPSKKTTTKTAKKKAARKRAPAKKATKRTRKTVKNGKKPENQANALAVIKQANPGITAEGIVELYNMPPEDVIKRRAFVHEYLKDFNEGNAALRMGYPVETSKSTGSILLYHAFTQLRITEILEASTQESVVTGTQIVAALWKEANAPDTPFSSSATTRIAALKELAKIRKLTGPSVPSGPLGGGLGGVMIVPAYVSPADWEDHAKASQLDLKKQAAVDAEIIEA